MRTTFLLAAAVLGLNGCIHTQKTTYRDEARMLVEFENDAAARIFYETLSNTRSSRSESSTEVSLPIIFEHKERVVQGESTAFNNAVLRCDTNRDGKITEAEARIYSEHAFRP